MLAGSSPVRWPGLCVHWCISRAAIEVEHGQISYEPPHLVELVGADEFANRPYGRLDGAWIPAYVETTVWR